MSQSGGEFDQNRNDFDILLNAVKASGLAFAQNNRDENITLIAPTDRAFIRLANDFGYTGGDEKGAFEVIVAALTELGSDGPIPTLTNVLLYHVTPESKTLKEITDAETVDTLLADASLSSFGVFLIDGAPQLREPALLAGSSNIGATKGIVHTINRVLIPLYLAPVSRPCYCIKFRPRTASLLL